MTTTITLVLDRDLNQDEKIMLMGLLRDAFGEFQSHRGPTPEQYVERRYPKTDNYAWLNRDKKVIEVTQRIELAFELHKACFGKLAIEVNESKK